MLIPTDEGPQQRTNQWSPDGINFDIIGRIGEPPKALGRSRTEDLDDTPRSGISRDLCHTYGGGNWRTDWNRIKRFDVEGK